jgi:hypothetical protein
MYLIKGMVLITAERTLRYKKSGHGVDKWREDLNRLFTRVTAREPWKKILNTISN